MWIFWSALSHGVRIIKIFSTIPRECSSKRHPAEENTRGWAPAASIWWKLYVWRPGGKQLCFVSGCEGAIHGAGTQRCPAGVFGVKSEAQGAAGCWAMWLICVCQHWCGDASRSALCCRASTRSSLCESTEVVCCGSCGTLITQILVWCLARTRLSGWDLGLWDGAGKEQVEPLWQGGAG